MHHLEELRYLQTYHEDIVSAYQMRNSVEEKNEELAAFHLRVEDKKDIYNEYDALRFLNACKKMVNDDRFDRITRPLKKPKTEVALRVFQRHLALFGEQEAYERVHHSDYNPSWHQKMREMMEYYIDRFSDDEWVEALPKKILKPSELRGLSAKEQQ